MMAAEVSESVASLPYHEPGIVVILILTFFLLLLNILNAALDKLLYCGLLGQVLIGIAWGSPGAKWLSASLEETVVQLGYLGLILLVYEGLSISYHFSVLSFFGIARRSQSILHLKAWREQPSTFC
jgi:hypothetical protein